MNARRESESYDWESCGGKVRKKVNVGVLKDFGATAGCSGRCEAVTIARR